MTIARCCTRVHDAVIVKRCHACQQRLSMYTFHCFAFLLWITYHIHAMSGRTVCLAALVLVGKKCCNKTLWNWHYHSDRQRRYISNTTAMVGPQISQRIYLYLSESTITYSGRRYVITSYASAWCMGQKWNSLPDMGKECVSVVSLIIKPFYEVFM